MTEVFSSIKSQTILELEEKKSKPITSNIDKAVERLAGIYTLAVDYPLERLLFIGIYDKAQKYYDLSVLIRDTRNKTSSRATLEFLNSSEDYTGQHTDEVVQGLKNKYSRRIKDTYSMEDTIKICGDVTEPETGNSSTTPEKSKQNPTSVITKK